MDLSTTWKRMLSAGLLTAALAVGGAACTDDPAAEGGPVTDTHISGNDTTTGGDATTTPDTPGSDTSEPDTSALDTAQPDGSEPEGCCSVDTDCDGGMVCAMGGTGKGVCLAPVAGKCWNHGECGPGQLCTGVMVCLCDVDCALATAPGTCVDVPECCGDGADCPDGTVCVPDASVCKDPPLSGSCWSDGDCAALGPDYVCAGAQVCPCGGDCSATEDKLGECIALPEGGCCESDEDCPSGQTCNVAAGVCKNHPPEPGQCWSHTNCAPGETCANVWVCPCDADCDGADEVGTCQPNMPGCCSKDDDCDVGLVCIPGGTESGICMEELAPGTCFVDGDCDPGEACLNAFFCPCNAPCFAPTMPGTCAPVGPLCCGSDDDCAEGQVCHPAANVCKDAPAAGQCWTAAHCGAGQACVGANVCPCDALCDAPDEPGTCEAVTPGCCAADEDCAGDAVCAPGGDPFGECAPPPAAGKCFDNADCDVGQTCQGATFCPCNADCDVGTEPGECVTDVPLGCCLTDEDCSAGLTCSGVPSFIDGFTTCAEPLIPGQCWADGDCDAGQVCDGAIPCPCPGVCAAANQPGLCQPAPGCSKDEDCGEGQVCLEDPCGEVGTCAPAPGEGACYQESDCGEGQVCDGGYICGCLALCEAPFGLGVCVSGDNECEADGDCLELSEVCIPGPLCLDGCAPGDYSCCFGNVCGPAESPCPGDNPQGCVETGCPEGQTCNLDVEICVPTSCSCDAATGAWVCTPDCTGGVCVDNG